MCTKNANKQVTWETSLSRQSIALVLTAKNKETKHYTQYIRNTKEEQKNLSQLTQTSQTLVWYAFYRLQPGNGAGPKLSAGTNWKKF